MLKGNFESGSKKINLTLDELKKENYKYKNTINSLQDLVDCLYEELDQIKSGHLYT